MKIWISEALFELLKSQAILKGMSVTAFVEALICENMND